MKITCVHTGAGEGIFGVLERAIKKELHTSYQISHMTNPAIIAEVAAENRVTPRAAADLMRMYMAAADSGADIILNVCSSVGRVADTARPAFELAGVRLMRIDRRMCETVVQKYSRIGVVATLRSTLDPSCELVRECAEKAGKEVRVQEFLADGAFGLNQEQLEKLIIQAIEPGVGQVEVLVFAQASMSDCVPAVTERFGLPVYASPAFGAQELAEIAAELE